MEIKSHSEEKIKIDRLLSISNSAINVPRVGAIIGPQASGKSALLKAIFFFREYILDYLNNCTQDVFSLRSFNNAKRDRFHAIFRGIEGSKQRVSAEYSYGNIELSIEKSASDKKARIKANRELLNLGHRLQRRARKTSNSNKNVQRSVFFGGIYDLKRTDPDVASLFETVPTTLFVPASRSFYSTISQQIFEFLSSEERIDPLTAQFGSFYEFHKTSLASDFSQGRSYERYKRELIKKMAPVLKGQYKRTRGRDFIETSWGTIPLDGSSSGQQEVFPLLISILLYPNATRPTDRLLIEEPEAHLYPEAQKYVLDLMMDMSESHNCGLLFTTHSPYILSCLNIHIARNNKISNSRRSIDAFFVSDGGISSLIDEEGFIDLNQLDSTSEVITRELFDAIDHD